jgi:hypothetical protein
MKVATMSLDAKFFQQILQDSCLLSRVVLVASHNLNLELIAQESHLSEDILSNTPRILTEIFLHNLDRNGENNA